MRCRSRVTVMKSLGKMSTLQLSEAAEDIAASAPAAAAEAPAAAWSRSWLDRGEAWPLPQITHRHQAAPSAATQASSQTMGSDTLGKLLEHIGGYCSVLGFGV